MPFVVPLGNMPSRQKLRMTRNVENKFLGADEDQHDYGPLWYPHAHDLAEEIGRSARIHSGDALSESESAMPDVTRGAGIIAALSPQNEWKQNVIDARLVARGRPAGFAPGREQGKANLIREGIHPSDVLNPERTGKAHKSWNFFQNINEPDDPNPVTIDRHAAAIAAGQRVGSGEMSDARRYNHYTGFYKTVGEKYGVNPNVVQATTWMAHTGRSTYDD